MATPLARTLGLVLLVLLSTGRSLKANIALVRNNARVAARTAVALARLKTQAGGR